MSQIGRLVCAVSLAALLLAAAGCGGSDSTASSSSTTTAAPTTTTTVAAATTTAPGGGAPPCTADAIQQAITTKGDQVTKIDDFKCGKGWAGANYDTTGDITVATLLQAQGSQWVVVDRAASCSDPTIPPDVHFYCTVS